MARKYEMDMSSGHLTPMILRFTIPLMLTSLLQLLYNAADIIVVGRYVGSTALAAVGSNSALINLIINTFIGLSTGAAVLLAQAYGANEYEKCCKIVHTAILTSIFSGIFLAIFGFVVCRPLLELMGSPADVIEQATLYMKIYFLGMPGFMFYTFGSAIMRTLGDTKRPLVFLSISGLVNVFLNLILVLVFNMGVAGVAIATIVSQYLSAVFVGLSLLKSDGITRIYIKELKIHWGILLQTIRIGLPIAIQSSVFSLSNVLIQSSVNSFGSDVVAGNAAAISVEGFLYVGMNAFSQAATTFIAQNYGAKQYKRVTKSMLICLAFSVLVGTVSGGLVLIFGKSLLKIYCPDNQLAIQYGMIRFIYICLPYAMCGIMDVISSSIRGTGVSLMPMIVSIIGVCGIRIVWVLTVFPRVHTLESLYISYFLSWTVTAIIHFFCFLYVKKTKLKPLNLQ